MAMLSMSSSLRGLPFARPAIVSPRARSYAGWTAFASSCPSNGTALTGLQKFRFFSLFSGRARGVVAFCGHSASLRDSRDLVTYSHLHTSRSQSPGEANFVGFQGRSSPWLLGVTALVAATALGAPNNSVLESDLDSGSYCAPPSVLLDIVDAPPTPTLSFSPDRTSVAFLLRPSLPPISELARPELKLAGLRIDPETNTRSRMSFYTGLSLFTLGGDDSLQEERKVTGLPPDCKINFVSWSEDGQRLALAVRLKDAENDNGCHERSVAGEERSQLSLWVVDVPSGVARKVLGLEDGMALNTVFETYAWLDESTIVASCIPLGRSAPPRQPRAPLGPKVQANMEEGRAVQGRTYQDLLQDETDARLLEYYGTSQLYIISLKDELVPDSVDVIQPYGQPQMITGFDPSNDGKYLLVSLMERPFSLAVPCGRFPKRIQVWDRNGSIVQEVAYLPLAEEIPIAFNSVRKGRRAISWRADAPSTLFWVEANDGGDARVEVSPRDLLFTCAVGDGSDIPSPQLLHELDLRFSGIAWGDDGLALVSESWQKTRRTRTWVIAPGPPPAASAAAEVAQQQKRGRLLFDRSYEDAYSSPGSPMVMRGPFGSYVLARVRLADEGTRLLMNGDGATEEGYIPFLDLLDVETGEKQRIWQSDREKFLESMSAILSDGGSKGAEIRLEDLRMLMSRESKQEPPQYFVRRWQNESLRQITDFPHPHPQLSSMSKEIIKYKREDGVQLTANLYLPPGYDAERDGPLPMLMWAYPREYKTKEAAGQVRGSPNSFVGIGGSSPAIWVAMGYAVLSGVAIPIIGEEGEQPNDKFVEQLVMSAQAAVDEVLKRKVAVAGSISIGGHSYGAFMTANLLAHAPSLFCCGIAESGAYNRTLTPFGFQAEDRSLWEAPATYMSMSPFMATDRIRAPLLLFHGQDDSNSGTFPLQSERFFAALKGQGRICRLVLLPYEGHGYRARESVLHVLAETASWLTRYCPPPSPPSAPEAAASEDGHLLGGATKQEEVEAAAVLAGAFPQKAAESKL